MREPKNTPFVPAQAGTQRKKVNGRGKWPLGSRFRGNERVAAASVLSVLAVLVLSLTSSVVWADDFYSGKTISLIIGSNTSGGYDTYGRLLARHMGKHIAGHPAIVVQNMPGAGGLRSANHIYNVAAKDGTVIGIFDQAVFLDQLLGRRDAARRCREVQLDRAA